MSTPWGCESLENFGFPIFDIYPLKSVDDLLLSGFFVDSDSATDIEVVLESKHLFLSLTSNNV